MEYGFCSATLSFCRITLLKSWADDVFGSVKGAKEVGYLRKKLTRPSFREGNSIFLG